MDPSGSQSRRWLTLIAMTGSLSMIMLDQTVVSVALPSMTRDLPLSPTGQQWVVNAYVLAMAALVAIGGKLGDRFGGVTMFRCGVTVFFLASVGCGLVPHGTWGEPGIIAFRALQGVGAALMMPVSAAIVMAPSRWPNAAVRWLLTRGSARSSWPSGRWSVGCSRSLSRGARSSGSTCP